ncbi:DUF4280 domain-containing protein [Aquimarina longa]|uniref:DUF4280 domain-containing protein n=1 Tax=Aquimarina longa TaxID=1080221 RepID=UPI000AA038E3|nr:PAAR-like protein [Aquimarina longa]
MAEEKFIPSNTFIECTGCKGVQSNLLSKTPNVFVKKQPMATALDALPSSITPFSGMCSFTNKVCTPIPSGKWKNPRKTVTTVKNEALIEQSTLQCSSGGIISIPKLSSTPPPPPNIIDKTQEKINTAANYAKQKADKLTQATGKTIEQIANTSKEGRIAKVFKNKKLQSMASNASKAIEYTNQKKEVVDTKVENTDTRISNLRLKLKEKITGVEQELQKLKEVNATEVAAQQKSLQTSEMTIEEKKELADNNALFDNANQESINVLVTHFDTSLIAPNTSLTLLSDTNEQNNLTSEKSILNTLNPYPTPAPPPVIFPPKKKSFLEKVLERNKAKRERDKNTASRQYDKYESQVHSLDSTINLGDKKDSLNALILLNNVAPLINSHSSPNTIVAVSPADIKGLKNVAKDKIKKKITTKIADKREELDTKVQAEIDELLKETGYTEKINEYKNKSEDLQEDLDKASSVMGALGDFNGFIDGLKDKAIGKVGAKYKKSLSQFTNNMELVNASLGGLSYAASGFVAGDVVTMAPDRKPEKEKEEETPPPTIVLEPATTSSGGGIGKNEAKCCYTKLKVIKNDTIEYTVIDEKKSIFKNIDVIKFVSGTTKNQNKLTLIIEGLERETCAQNHSNQDLIYTKSDNIFGSLTEEHSLPLKDLKTNSFDIKIHATDHISIFKDFMDIFIIGIKSIMPVIYRIPVDTCKYSKEIIAETYLDAEWHLLLTLKPNDPLTYSHTGFKPRGKDAFRNHQSIAVHIGRRNLNLPYSEKGAQLSIGCGVIYNDKSQSHNLLGKFPLKKIEDSSHKLFSILGLIDKYTKKVTGDQRKSKSKLGVKVAVYPPSLSLKLSGGLEDQGKSINTEPSIYGNLTIDLEPLISAEIFIDLVVAANKHPFILLLDATIHWIETKVEKIVRKVPFKGGYNLQLPGILDFLTFEIELNFGFRIGGSIDFGTSRDKKITAGGMASLKINAGIDLKLKMFGVSFVAGVEGKGSGTLEADTTVGFDGNVYCESMLQFSGAKVDVLIYGEISGFIFEIDRFEKGYKSPKIGSFQYPMDKMYFTGSTNA